MHQKFVKVTTTEDTVSVFGGGISFGGYTDFHVFPRGTMNIHIYRDGILDAHLHLYAGAIDNDLLLQSDNSKPHRACIVEDYLQHHTVLPMGWPV